ncbi:hypothetical protein [Nonomuraea candida]|uniref:hypothetical protein n=1 Tax=Nonomuraea candida TaxID=359159 RepID=UPI0012FBE5F8|nr:hypothetical protein [Nonomuraea candida]
MPTSWPEPPQARPEPSWPEPPRKDPSWPEPPGAARAGRQDGRAAWPETSSSPDVRASWPDAASSPDVRASWPGPVPADVPVSWPEASGKGEPLPQGRPSPGQPPVPDPVPAWAQPPVPTPGAWSNLSSPAPWPPSEAAAERTAVYAGPAPPPDQERPAGGPPQDAPPHDNRAPRNLPPQDHGPRNPAPHHSAPHNPAPQSHVPQNPPSQNIPSQNTPPQNPAPQSHPADERTVTYAHHQDKLLNDRAVPSTSMDSAHTDTPTGDDQAARPGSNLSRDPSDPQNRFVTAGQISGSRTPPPERQQELWNTVFGDDYQAMGDQDGLDDEGSGKPIWIYALGGSVAIALVAALLWAFLWGPLAGEEPSSANLAGGPATTAPKASTTKSSTTIGPLPKYPGKASTVIGRVPDAAAGITVPRLGGTWQLDERPTVKNTYAFETRQYVQVAPQKYAQLMSGPLSPRLASYYEPDNLEPVIKQVVLSARKRFFPADNKVRKIAQQAIKVGDQTGRLIAYSLTSDTEKATIVTMAVNTGGEVPAIVYMSIPEESKQLLPDIRVVMNQIRLGTQS